MAHVIINEVCADVHPSRLDAALDLEILVTERYTGDYFLQEIKGLADSSGVDYKVTYNSVTTPSLMSSCTYYALPENTAYPHDR